MLVWLPIMFFTLKSVMTKDEVIFHTIMKLDASGCPLTYLVLSVEV